MAKDINLTSQQWNDIIFEGKNKDYGAYEMRQSSSKRHVIAFLSTLILAIFVAILPVLAEQVAKALKPTNITTTVEITDLTPENNENEDIIEELTKKVEEIPIESIAYVAPIITDASQIDESNELKTIDELKESDLRISIKDVFDGAKTGRDIAELEAEWAAANVKKDEVIDVHAVEVFPEFPGGDAELTKFLTDNLVYPRMAKELNIQGRVMVQFVVNKSGAITDVVVQKSPSNLLSEEAVRVTKLMPKWIPGKQNGKSVNVRFLLPVDFKLN